MGSIDQTGAIEDVKFEKEAESNQDFKNGVKLSDTNKAKSKRKLYVGSQALGYRRDFMEVRLKIIFSTHKAWWHTIHLYFFISLFYSMYSFWIR